MEEIFKRVEGYDNKYLVSSCGRVYSEYTKRFLIAEPNSSGYLRVNLRKDGKSSHVFVHRLVAIAFLEQIAGKEEVNHIDGDKSNNAVENLEWVSRSENERHARNNKLKISTSNKLLVIFQSEEKRYFSSNRELATYFKVHPQTVTNWLRTGNYGKKTKDIRKIVLLSPQYKKPND